jgi:hypothetical protein
MQWQAWDPSPRDILIDRVRRGELTPEDAEQEAERHGFGPLATKPPLTEFDPDKMHWWSLPMAVAWIAWRNSAIVRDHCAEFAKQCLYWTSQSWNVPINNGTEFARIEGHELKELGRPTVCRLALAEALPPIMTVAEAEKQLFAELAAGRIIAIAKDATGNVVEIPQREWPYLQRYEEGQADVLKYAALDSRAAFSEIKLERESLEQVWPQSLVNANEPRLPILPTFGAISLALAAHWIASERGTVPILLSVTNTNSERWRNAYRDLAGAICAGHVEATGRKDENAAPEPIPAHLFADIPVCFPSHDLASDKALFEHVVTDKFQLEACPDQDGSGAEIREGRKVWFARVHVNAAQVLVQWPKLPIAAIAIQVERPSHRPRHKREGVKAILQGLSPSDLNQKIEALLALVNERIQGGSVSKDTLRRALNECAKAKE